MNALTEFIGKFRDEGLSVEWFRSRAEAEVIIEIAHALAEPQSRRNTTEANQPVAIAIIAVTRP
jgi:hypothetical protein